MFRALPFVGNRFNDAGILSMGFSPTSMLRQKGNALIAALLLFLWFVFNAKMTWELLAFGLTISLGISWFVHRFVIPGFTHEKQWRILRSMPDYLRYLWLLIREIIKANFSVMRLVFTDRDIVVPKLASFKTRLNSPFARVVFADSITLTPGTITVHMQGDEFLVHCLDEGMEEGLAGGVFDVELLRLEAKLKGEAGK